MSKTKPNLASLKGELRYWKQKHSDITKEIESYSRYQIFLKIEARKGLQILALRIEWLEGYIQAIRDERGLSDDT